ncbi:hypothetical protein [Mammaliicoccus sp. Dog046]|uniref:hypothetical protein n=1 Tax=Mammaliicoccus sp. Dog046 TaxID=3034233 RepID=UPI002B25E023|nr:hypothetical protein [Mammaliicoccus sp. Dog046]WQK85430.1 hypothetical protein P3U32_12615 [Mammaliicoccus sp. Dog046]
MKTDKLYKEYLEANKKQDKELKTLEQKRNELVAELTEVEQVYGLATNNGEFEKAQEAYKEVLKAKEKLKEHDDLIKIKQDTVPAIKRKNLFKLLSSVNDLRSFYIDEAEDIQARLNNAIEEYNGIIEELSDLNMLYNDDLSKYDNLHYFLSVQDKHLFKNQHGEWKAKTRNMINHKGELDKVEISKY